MKGTFLWTHWSELGIPDYEGLLREGLDARIKRAEERLEEIDRTVPRDYIDQKEFLQAVIIVLKAVIRFSGRYAALATEMAASEKDSERKARLDEIARTCSRIPANPPSTFIEAVQFFYFIHLIRYLEYSTLGIGLRLDYIFGPYYEKDIQAGTIKKNDALEILQLLWVKFLELGLVYSPLVTSVYGGVASLQAITLGGRDKEGRDVTNDLTYLALETARTMRTIEPSIALRIHKDTPDELLSAATDTIRTGIGYPSFFNDEALIPLLEKWGVPPEDAKMYGVSGCVYMEIPGKNITRRVLGYFVLAKCLWWALHQGVNPKTGEQWGARTPDPATFKSWQDVLDAYLTQSQVLHDKNGRSRKHLPRSVRKILPEAFLLSDCGGVHRARQGMQTVDLPLHGP